MTISRDELWWFKEQYYSGKSIRELSDETRLSFTAVRHRLKKSRTKMRAQGQRPDKPGQNNPVTYEQMVETVRLYVDMELSTIQISERLGIASSTVVWRLQRMGVPIRSRQEALQIRFKNGRKKNASAAA